MADADDKKKEEEKKEEEGTKTEEDKQPAQTGTKTGILTWVIMAVIVVLLTGSGFFLGRLFAGSSSPEATESSQTDESASPEDPKTDDSGTEPENTWYYNNLEPVVANLDEPSVTRFVRVDLKLEISSAMEQIEYEKVLEEKKPLLTNWLTIYLASLTLEDARGDRNLKRIQLQILDAFNEELFPDAKPQIKRVLFNEFVIN